jgi:hypothetical protein
LTKSEDPAQAIQQLNTLIKKNIIIWIVTKFQSPSISSIRKALGLSKDEMDSLQQEILKDNANVIETVFREVCAFLDITLKPYKPILYSPVGQPIGLL